MKNDARYYLSIMFWVYFVFLLGKTSSGRDTGGIMPKPTVHILLMYCAVAGLRACHMPRIEAASHPVEKNHFDRVQSQYHSFVR